MLIKKKTSPLAWQKINQTTKVPLAKSLFEIFPITIKSESITIKGIILYYLTFISQDDYDVTYDYDILTVMISSIYNQPKGQYINSPQLDRPYKYTLYIQTSWTALSQNFFDTCRCFCVSMTMIKPKHFAAIRKLISFIMFVRDTDWWGQIFCNEKCLYLYSRAISAAWLHYSLFLRRVFCAYLVADTA